MTSYFSGASMFTTTPRLQCDADVFLSALADAIARARKGEAENIVHRGEHGYETQMMDEKLKLFRDGALMAITLTKTKGPLNQQLRGWIGGPSLLFLKEGSHVDGYGSRGVFEASGDLAFLLEMTEKHLAKRMRRFEDELYVVWI